MSERLVCRILPGDLVYATNLLNQRCSTMLAHILTMAPTRHPDISQSATGETTTVVFRIPTDKGRMFDTLQAAIEHLDSYLEDQR